MPRTYTLTYDCVTPESAEDDHGFGDGASLCSTSLSHLDIYTESGVDPEIRRAEWRAARDAATKTIEPDEHDRDEAEDELTARDVPEGEVCAECERVWSHARDCRHRVSPVPTDAAIESHAAVKLVVALIRDHYGANEPSCSPSWSKGCWYTTPDGSTDYATGEVTCVSVHLDGWTEDECRAVYAAVTARR